MLRPTAVAPALVLLIVAGAACRSKEAPPPPTAVTADEARALGEELEQWFAKCDAAAIDGALDLDYMIRLAAADTPLTETERQGMIRGARRMSSFGEQLCSDVATGTQYRLLRVREQGHEVSVVFRALGERGLDYLEFYAAKGAANRPRIYDVYTYTSGERMSEAMRDMLVAFIQSPEMGDQATLLAREIENAKRHLMAGESEQARAALSRLPESLRARRPVRLFEVMAAAGLGDQEYEKAIAAYERAYPGDPSLDLVSLDGYVIRKQYDNALAALDRLGARVGGDPYLDAMHASLLSEKGDLDGAWKRIHAVIEAGSELEDSYWIGLNLALKRSAFDDAVKIMSTLRDRFGAQFDPELMAAEPLYTAFLKSPQWAAWSATGAAPAQ